MIMVCNQICYWNDPSDGCVKPPAGFCPMSNVLAYQKPQTNADRFRAMSDEEQQKCVRGFWEIEDFADWLQQPAEEMKEK
jgi:hypothetical protein